MARISTLNYTLKGACLEATRLRCVRHSNQSSTSAKNNPCTESSIDPDLPAMTMFDVDNILKGRVSLQKIASMGFLTNLEPKPKSPIDPNLPRMNISGLEKPESNGIAFVVSDAEPRPKPKFVPSKINYFKMRPLKPRDRKKWLPHFPRYSSMLRFVTTPSDYPDPKPPTLPKRRRASLNSTNDGLRQAAIQMGQRLQLSTIDSESDSDSDSDADWDSDETIEWESTSSSSNLNAASASSLNAASASNLNG